MVDIANYTCPNKQAYRVRYLTRQQTTWIHATDVCTILQLKYQTKKFKNLVTQRILTRNKANRRTLQLYVLAAELVHIYKKSTNSHARRWLTNTFSVTHLEKSKHQNRYTEMLTTLFNDEEMCPRLRKKIKLFLEEDGSLPPINSIVEVQPDIEVEADPETDLKIRKIYFGDCMCHHFKRDGKIYVELETILGELRIDWSPLAFIDDQNFETVEETVIKQNRGRPFEVPTVFIHIKEVQKLSKMRGPDSDLNNVYQKLDTLF
jgi:hypothetical protein